MKIEFLLQYVSSINKKYEGIAQVTGENFNIFQILKIEAREVSTHSAFLAELLKPKGSHGQGDAFLKLFVNLFKVESFDEHNKIDAEVFVEENIGDISEDYSSGGRIDIVVKPKGKGMKEIVIENKIYARDQYKSLVRYKEKYPNCKLFYLTLDGKNPEDSSIEVAQSNNLEKGKDYFTLSYKDDILSWLHLCRKEATNHPILRETLTQYINLIKHLTNQTMNDTTKNEIVTTVLKNSDNIESAENIANLWTDIKFKIIDNLREGIVAIAKNLTLEIKFSDCILGKKDSGFWFFKRDWKYCIYFEFQTDFEYLWVGIDTLDSNFRKEPQLKESLKKTFSNIGKNLDDENWMWVCQFDKWENTAWKDVESIIPNAIKEMVEFFLKRIEEENIGL